MAGGKSVAIFGYPIGKDLSGNYGPWNHEERVNALAELRNVQARGGTWEDLTEASKNILARSSDSFTAPTFTMMDSLADAGIPIAPDPIRGTPGVAVGLPPRYSQNFPRAYAELRQKLAQTVADDSVGALLQVGYLPNEFKPYIDQARSSGKYFGRLATDYGSGGFLQPKFHTHGFDNLGRPRILSNGMYIDPVLGYDAVYIPGKNLRTWTQIPPSVRTVGIGGLASSPLFDTYRFGRTDPRTINALLFTGGGSGIGLPFEIDYPMGDIAAGLNRSFVHPKENTLDFILNALRSKASSTNKKFNLNFLTGLQDDPYFSTVEAAREAIRLRDAFDYKPIVGAVQDVNRLRYLLDPNSSLHKLVSQQPGGQQFLNELLARYNGLHMIGRVPQTGMAKAYATSDIIYGLPGSSLGEISRIAGQETPGVVHLVPRELQSYPRHFYGNALAYNELMQPNARHNIARVGSPTFAEDIMKATNESGFRNWGRRPIIARKELMAPLVTDVSRALGRVPIRGAGGPSGSALGKLSSLFKILRHIK